jgi:glyoxylase-like metal-dependent hydrolase (beta-lactamase superfamily II)
MDDSARIEEVAAEDLYSELQRGDRLCILDVRNEEEFTTWRIEGPHHPLLLHIPYFAFLEDEAEGLAKLPRDCDITVVCAKGGSSAFVASMLLQHGIHARNLQGGMIAWGDLHVTTTLPRPQASEVIVIQVNRIGKRCLSYGIVSDGEALIIDPSRHIERYGALAEAQQATLTGVIDTHLHADHLSGGPELSRVFGVPYYIRLDDAPGAAFAYRSLGDGAQLMLGSSVVEIIAMHTPGHTPGSTSLLVDAKYLLTGDTLFVNGIGRPDLGHKAEEWAELLYRTLFERMATLSDDVLILPAHYSSAAETGVHGVVGTTLGEARANNPVFRVKSEAEFLSYVLEHLPPQPPEYQDIRRANLGQLKLDAEHAMEAELGPNQCAAALPPIA